MKTYVDEHWELYIGECKKNLNCIFEIGAVRFKVYSNCRWSVSLIKKYLSFHFKKSKSSKLNSHQLIIFKNLNIKFTKSVLTSQNWEDKLSDGTDLHVSKLDKDYIIMKVGKEVIMYIDNINNRTIIEYTDRTFKNKIIHPNPVSYMVPFLNIVLSYHENYMIHSASIKFKKKSLLILGGSGAGKTTMSLILAKNGFKFRSDDLTILSIEDNKLYSYPLLLKPKIKNKKFLKLFKYSYYNSLLKSEITKLLFIKYFYKYSFELKIIDPYTVFKLLYNQLNDPKLYYNSKNLIKLLFKLSENKQSYFLEIGPSEKFDIMKLKKIL